MLPAGMTQAGGYVGYFERRRYFRPIARGSPRTPWAYSFTLSGAAHRQTSPPARRTAGTARPNYCGGSHRGTMYCLCAEVRERSCVASLRSFSCDGRTAGADRHLTTSTAESSSSPACFCRRISSCLFRTCRLPVVIHRPRGRWRCNSVRRLPASGNNFPWRRGLGRRQACGTSGPLLGLPRLDASAVRRSAGLCPKRYIRGSRRSTKAPRSGLRGGPWALHGRRGCTRLAPFGLAANRTTSHLRRLVPGVHFQVVVQG